MKLVRAKDYRPATAWEALSITEMNGISVRLHWTDQPYRWHINDGQEVFAVMDGQVNMHYRLQGQEHVATLLAGDLFFADVGCEHVAHPLGEARILVIERQGSV